MQRASGNGVMLDPHYSLPPHPYHADLLHSWEISSSFRSMHRAMQIIENHEDLVTSMESHSVAMAFHANKSLESNAPPKCPPRPYHLMRTHITITPPLPSQLISSSQTSASPFDLLLQSIGEVLAAQLDYDFSYFARESMWRGKYLSGSVCMLVHIHLYCDIQSKTQHETQETGGKGVESSETNAKHIGCSSNSNSSGGDECASISYILELCKVAGEAYAFHSLFRDIKDALAHKGLIESGNHSSNTCTSGSTGSSVVEGESSFPSSPCKESDAVRSFRGMSCPPLLLDQLPVGEEDTQLSAERYLDCLKPLVAMAASPYYEVRLEACKMLCDLSPLYNPHPHAYLTAPEQVPSLYPPLLAPLLHVLVHDHFDAVREAALMALGGFRDTPGFGNVLLDWHDEAAGQDTGRGRVLAILLSLVSNPPLDAPAYESLAARREAARILLSILQQVDLGLVQQILEPWEVQAWAERVSAIQDQRLREIAEEAKLVLVAGQETQSQNFSITSSFNISSLIPKLPNMTSVDIYSQLKRHDHFFQSFINLVPKDLYYHTHSMAHQQNSQSNDPSSGQLDGGGMGNEKYFKHRKQPLTADERKVRSVLNKKRKYAAENADILEGADIDDADSNHDDGGDSNSVEEPEENPVKKAAQPLKATPKAELSQEKLEELRQRLQNRLSKLKSARLPTKKPLQVNNKKESKKTEVSKPPVNKKPKLTHAETEDSIEELKHTLAFDDSNDGQFSDADDGSSANARQTSHVEADIEFGVVQDGLQRSNMSKNNLSKHQSSHPAKKDGGKVQRMKKILQEAEKKRERYQSLLQSKNQVDQQKLKSEQWQDVLRLAAGEKIIAVDTSASQQASSKTEQKIKKALKKHEKKKQQSANQWAERIQKVEETKREKQEKREENIQSRKMQKLGVPKEQDKKDKKSNRAGFEGKKDTFLNGDTKSAKK